MRAITKIIFLDEQGEKFFGEGPARLLHGVEETGSLRAAAMSMNMAYTQSPEADSQRGGGAGLSGDFQKNRRQGRRRKQTDRGRKGVAVSL